MPMKKTVINTQLKRYKIKQINTENKGFTYRYIGAFANRGICYWQLSLSVCPSILVYCVKTAKHAVAFLYGEGQMGTCSPGILVNPFPHFLYARMQRRN